MELSGCYRFDRDRETVLAAVSDPRVLARSVPFLASLRTLGPGRYAGVLALRFGPLRLPVDGFAEIEPVEPPERYRVRVGRRPSGGREVLLALRADGPEAALVGYRVAVGALGPFAPFGRAWVARTAAEQSGRFFQAVAREMGARVAPAPEAADALWRAPDA